MPVSWIDPGANGAEALLACRQTYRARPIVGAQPTDVFVAAVESAITGATGRAAQQADPTDPAGALTEG